MTVTTKFPTANETETTGWTNPNNAHADEGTYTTAAPGKNASIATRYKTWGFDAAIPASPTPTITKVQIIYEYKVDTNKSAATMRTRARISDVDEEDHDDTSEPLADSAITVDITADRAWTRADLLDATFKVTMAGVRGNSNNAVTFSLDYVKAEVTWTSTTTYQQTVAATATGVPGLTKAATFSRTLTASSAGVAGLTKAPVYSQALAAVAVGVAGLSRVATYSRTLAVASVGVVTLARAASLFRTLAATSVGVVAFSTAAIIGQTLTATATGVAALAKTYISGVIDDGRTFGGAIMHFFMR